MLAAYPFHQLVTCTFPILFWWETLQPTTSARETQVVLCLSISYTYSCIILGAGYFIMVSNVNHVTSNGTINSEPFPKALIARYNYNWVLKIL